MTASRSNYCLPNKLLFLNFETQGDICAKGLAPSPGSVTHCYVIMGKSLQHFIPHLKKWNWYDYDCSFSFNLEQKDSVYESAMKSIHAL